MGAIVGRARELAEVDAALAEARAGRGRLLLVSGPPGIGKSRLAEAAAERAVALGLSVASGYAVDDPGAPPLWPWSRALRDRPGAAELLGGGSASGEPGAAARFRLFVAVSDRIAAEAAAAGLLLVLEDMHWADRMSVQLLRHLTGALPTLPVCVVVTARERVPSPLADATPDLVRGDTTRVVTPDALSAADVARWLPTLTGAPADGLAAVLHRRTGGNPLLVRLVAEQLADAGDPDGAADPDAAVDRLIGDRPELRRIVGARLAPLSAAAQQLVQAAGVLGERITPAVLATMVEQPRSRLRPLLDEAVASGVLTVEGDRLRFVHALVRDAAYAELPPSRRGELHERAARALEQRGVADLAGVIAHHWRQVDHPEAQRRCAIWAERADDAARRVIAYSDAVRFAELALDGARAGGAADGEQARLLVRLAEAGALAHEVRAAVADCSAAARLAEAADLPQLMAAAALVVHGTGDSDALDAIQQLCVAALARLPDDEPTLRARLTAQLAVSAAESGAGKRAGELAAQALSEAEESGDATALVEAIAARHLAISVPLQVGERLELGRRAVALGSRARHPVAALWGHLWRTDAALQLGNLLEAERELAEIDRIARRDGSILARWHHHRFTAVIHQLAGRFPQARAENDASRRIAEDLGDVSMLGMYYAFGVELSVLRGDPRELDPRWEQMVAHAPPIPLVRITRSVVHALQGEIERARSEFAEFRRLPETYPVGLRWWGTMGQIALAAELLDDVEVAGAVYAALLPIAHYYSGDGSGGVFSHGAVARVVADAARVAGRHDDAVRLYPDAVAMNARIGARPFTALSRLGWAESLLARGRAEELPMAVELGRAAAAEFRRLDMPGPLTRAARVIEDGERARRAVSPLTEREAEVAALVAAALSNRQIAERLVLSERTVESHVRSILGKLGFTSRTEIATWSTWEGNGR